MKLNGGRLVKPIVMAGLSVAMLGLPAAAQAATVTLTDWTTGHFATNAPGGGGAFRATTAGGDPILGNISFLTFCLEYNEHFNYGGTYNFTLSDGAVQGGVAGGNPDPVSDATKWLYYQAVSGGYVSVFGALGAAVTSAGSHIQQAIWLLEQEKTSGQVSTVANNLANFAGLAPQLANWTLLQSQGHRVYAMNLTTIPGGGVVQDQLAYVQVAVPEPGTFTLAAAALSLLGIAGSRGRRRNEE